MKDVHELMNADKVVLIHDSQALLSSKMNGVDNHGTDREDHS